MKYLHIIPNWNYPVMIPYIKFINENFDKKEHIFILKEHPSNVPADLLGVPNLEIIDNESKVFPRNVIEYISEAEKILVHCITLNIYQMSYFLLNPKYFKKIFWISWGADLYEWKSNKTKTLKEKIFNKVSYIFRKRIKHFVGIFPPDITYFQKEFNSEAETFYASYVGNLNSLIYQKDLDLTTLNQKQKNNQTINIQIGHQGNPVLKHLEVLEDLHKFKNEDIKIYIPLNYGPSLDYMKKVEHTAKEYFKDKAVIVKERMSKDDYMDFLSTIDLAIFNTTRQIGLGNITPLLYMGKKIYMPEGSVMYDFYQSQGIKVSNYNVIPNVTFDEFIEPIDMRPAKNYVVENELSLSNKIKMWSSVFDAPEN